MKGLKEFGHVQAGLLSQKHYQSHWYQNPDGSLDMPKLLQAFQDFFRENSQSWIERFDYKEAGPQLLLQAFLQRVINGGGRINREYGLGRGRTDLLVTWPTTDEGFLGPIQKIVIELKIQHKSLEHTLQTGLEQTAAYAQTAGTKDAHLIIFNRDPDVSWDTKCFHQTHTTSNIQVWGM